MLSEGQSSKPGYHFIGIGGIGMSGLAELLVRQGYEVSGSELSPNAHTERLRGLGVRIFAGHRAENLGEAEEVVYSTAVKEDNPELRAARAQGRRVWRRGEMLARLMEGHYQIAVTGAHGKTSTTAMAAAVLGAGGLEPTVLVGAVWNCLGSNARLGRGQYFVAEADESDGSFLYLRPQMSVLTNVDREHLDYYRDVEHIKETFARYLEQLPAEGVVVVWRDDPHLREITQGLRQRLVTYSLEGEAELRATDIRWEGLGSRYILWHQDHERGEIFLPMRGPHYVLNSLAACGVGLSLGLDFSVCQRGLRDLGGIQRRCEVKGEAGGVLVLDDYGHHPAEIRTTLVALAGAFPGRRLVVVFQPHRYSRTRALLGEFFSVFGSAELVFVTEIYSAGEAVMPDLSGRQIYEGIRREGHPAVWFVPERESLTEAVLGVLQPGDVVLTLGAGDIWRTGEELLKRLKVREKI